MRALESHLARLEASLKSLPDPPEWTGIWMVEAREIEHLPNRPSFLRIPRPALKEPLEYASRFDDLLLRGYRWINLVGLGILGQVLLVSVEFPDRAGTTPAGQTSVNLSGPNLTPAGRPHWNLGSRVEILS
jgi:hypothetical protein